MSTEITPTDKLAIARVKAIKLAPYFRSNLLTLIPRETPGAGTLAVTKSWVMLWDPVFVAKTPEIELAAVIIHEMMHVTLNHHARCAAIGAEPEMWNYAADAAINDSLSGLPLPSNCITPVSLGLPSGLTAEGYYRALEAKKAQEQKDNENKQSDKSPQSDNSAQSGDNDKDNKDSDSGKNKQSDKGEPSKRHSCGSCSGNTHEKESELGDEGRTNAEIARAQKETARAIQAEASKGAGNVPGALVEWSSALLAPPSVPWRKQLANLVRLSATHRAGMVNNTYNKLSRRQAGIGYGFGKPTLAAYHAPIPTIGVAIDVSGSMDETSINAALSEVQGIARANGSKVLCCTFTEECGPIGSIATANQARKMIKSRGGTNFVPVFEAYAKHKVDILIILTDGYAPCPPHAPSKCKVVWSLIGKHTTAPAPWGSVVNIG